MESHAFRKNFQWLLTHKVHVNEWYYAGRASSIQDRELAGAGFVVFVGIDCLLDLFGNFSYIGSRPTVIRESRLARRNWMVVSEAKACDVDVEGRLLSVYSSLWMEQQPLKVA